MTEYEALKVLDKVSRETNIYQLIVELSERAHQADRNRFEFKKTNPIEAAFTEVLLKPKNSDE